MIERAATGSMWAAALLVGTSLATSDPVNAAQPTPDVDEAAEASLTAAGVPAGWLERATEEIRILEYRFSPHPDGGWTAPNRAHNLRTRIDGDGLHLAARSGDSDWQVSMRLHRFGRKGAARAVHAGEAALRDGRVEIHREGLPVVEWYLNDERGLEQGFTIDARPRGRRTRPLVLALAVEAPAGSRADGEGSSLLFRGGDGATWFRYGGLVVKDSTGRKLEARMQGFDRKLRIEVDDNGAVYPVTVDPVIRSVAWTSPHPDPLSLATAGDVNGDGFSDIILGHPGFPPGDPGGTPGRAFLYLGSPAGPAVSPSWSAEISSNVIGGAFATSVRAAGDIDDDGYDDIIIGACEISLGAQGSEGGAFVWLGRSNFQGSGTATSADWTVMGNPLFYEGFGCGACGDRIDPGICGTRGDGVGTAGDVNGDGYDDVFVTSTLGDSSGFTDNGGVSVFYGSATFSGSHQVGTGGIAGWFENGGVEWARFGHSASAAGDVNGDGFGDLVVGAPGLHPDGSGIDPPGQAFVYLGSASGLSHTPVVIGSGPANPRDFGDRVSLAGDVDRDGFADFFVARWGFNGLFVYEGASGGPATTPTWVLGQGFIGPSAAGDVNGDGYGDVMASDGSNIRLWYGGAGGLITSPVLAASGVNRAAPAGDVNGDGFGDVLAQSAGVAELHLGSARGLSLAGQGLPPGEIAAGDVTGDGYADLLIGNPAFDAGGGENGAVSLSLGGPDGLQALSLVQTGPAGARLGASLAVVGDTDEDGIQDWLVGSPGRDVGANGDVGEVQLFLGNSSGGGFDNAWSVFGSQSGEQLGAAVGSAGDVNGDGVADAVVGAPTYWAGVPGINIQEGRAHLYLGVPGIGLTSFPVWTGYGGGNFAAFGQAVGPGGDLNGDGYSDFVVGAPGSSRALVCYGVADFVTAPCEATWQTPSSSFGEWGAAIASGDHNADGFSDLVLGAPGSDLVTLHYGSASGLSPAFIAWSAPILLSVIRTGVISYGGFGSSLANAGDVDADGTDEFLVGAPSFVACDPAFFPTSCVPLPPIGLAALIRFISPPLWVFPPFTSSVPFLDVGRDVAGGDFDGDGFSDVAVGSSTVTFVFDGNPDSAGGAPVTPLQSQDVPLPVSSWGPPLARFNKAPGRSVQLKMQPWLPGGRDDMALEVEVKPVGQPFDGMGLQRGTVRDSGSPMIPLLQPLASVTVTNLAVGTAFHWRMRTITGSPFFPRSPWFVMGAGRVAETDLRVPLPASTSDRDADGVRDDLDNCPTVANTDQADMDSDGVGDLCDNCQLHANPRDAGGGATASFTGNQLDCDMDGYGNACDGDFNQMLPVVGFPDLAQLRQALGKDRDSNDCLNDDGSPGGPCAEFDLDGNLPIIGFPDLARFRPLNGATPGPKCAACPLPNEP